MQLPIGKYYHNTLNEIVKITPACIQLSKREPMSPWSTFIEFDDDILEVTASLMEKIKEGDN